MLFRFRYPKLVLFVVAIILSYLIFKNPNVDNFILGLGSLSYLGVLISGFLFSFGFTAPLSVGFFVTLNPDNLILNALIGALGAMISNMLIFGLIRISFKNEIFSLEKALKKDIERIRIMRETENFFNHLLGARIKHYFMYVFIGIIIASPIPNELGDALLAGMRKINIFVLAFLSFILSFIGIIILLLI